MRSTRLRTHKQAFRGIFLLMKLITIFYLSIFSLSYLSSDTSAHFTNQPNVSSMITAGTWEVESEVDVVCDDEDSKNEEKDKECIAKEVEPEQEKDEAVVEPKEEKEGEAIEDEAEQEKEEIQEDENIVDNDEQEPVELENEQDTEDGADIDLEKLEIKATEKEPIDKNASENTKMEGKSIEKNDNEVMEPVIEENDMKQEAEEKPIEKEESPESNQ